MVFKFLKRKKEKEEEKTKEEENTNYYEDYIIYKDKIYVSIDKIKDLKDIRLLKENIFVKKKEWYNPFSWFKKRGGIRNNVVLLLDDESRIKIIDNVRSGFFALKKGNELHYYILNENKLRTLDLETEDGKLVKCWVLDINNPTALPSDVDYDVSDVSNIITKAIAGNKNLENLGKSDLSWLKWIFLGIGILFVIYLLAKNNIFGLGDILGVTKNAIETQAINESSKVIPGGVLKG